MRAALSKTKPVLPETKETRRCRQYERKTCLVYSSKRSTATFITETCRETSKIQSAF